jgi:hypothetical protein
VLGIKSRRLASLEHQGESDQTKVYVKA